MQFLKIIFGSMVGFLLGLLFLLLITAGIVGFVVSSLDSREKTKIEENSVLHLDLSMPIVERKSEENPLAYLNANVNDGKPVGLNDMLESIKHAATDAKIKGIFIEGLLVNSGKGTLMEIRNALKEFKKSGKFIIAYSEYFSNSSYFLMSVADQIYINPAGEILFNGLGSSITFFNGALKKLGVKAQVIRHGKFKGAVEPFILDKLSPENRIQIEKYVNTLWTQMLDEIALSRKIPVNELRRISHDLLVQNPTDAVQYRLLDSVLYQDQVDNILKTKLKIKEKKKVKLVSISKYRHSFDENEMNDEGKEKIANKIAIIYINGDIVSGNGDDNSAGSNKISREIKVAREDSTVKAIVLRINSPGGSALASEVIWREVSLTKKSGKPIVVSMGDVAASGGYFIACAADSIFALPTTITGSIGVFGIIPDISNLMHDKLGITTDRVNTGKFSDFGSIDRPLTTEEYAILQHHIDKIYGDFISHVSEGRKIPVGEVDSIGQGRVWAGNDALTIRLVDKLGGLKDAIACAARMARLKKYWVSERPVIKSPFDALMDKFNDNGEEKVRKALMGEYYIWLQQIQQAAQKKETLAIMPYLIQTN